MLEQNYLFMYWKVQIEYRKKLSSWKAFPLVFYDADFQYDLSISCNWVLSRLKFINCTCQLEDPQIVFGVSLSQCTQCKSLPCLHNIIIYYGVIVNPWQ